MHVLEAWFAGRGYDTHRHDTYAVGVTDAGVQAFDYRGAVRTSTPGQVVVLHPDEPHDGRAGTPAGFGYRIVYVAPGLVHEAVRAICGRRRPLPFVRETVQWRARLASIVSRALRVEPVPLAADGVVVALAEALLEADGSATAATPPRLDARALAQARAFLDAETTRVIRSAELEAVAGLSRYELARQFRVAFGTSPYRYSLMRRLDCARAALSHHRALADVALGAGFADQAHFSRMFRAAHGLSPARYRRLLTARD